MSVYREVLGGTGESGLDSVFPPELKKEKLEQCVRVSSDKLRMVVVDSHSRQHTLVKDDDVQIIDTEKAQREKVLRDSVTWPQFLKQMREDLAEETSAKVKSRQSEEDEGEDDALQEAILASIAEQKHRKQRGAPLKSTRRSLFLEDAGEEAERMNGYYEDAFTDSDGADDGDDDDFEEVPELEDADFPGRSAVAAKPTTPRTPPPSTSATSARKRAPGGFIPSEEGASADAADVVFVEDSDAEETEADYFARKQTGRPAALGLETERDSEGVYADCQQLLALLGLPYMVAPGEAEAQCARLEQLRIVDGVVTDDSDVWLFGGTCVYKDLFSRKRHVHEYNADTIREKLGLGQTEFILIAMLAGGDYTDGFEKVGVTTALEIIAEFSAKSREEQDALSVLQKIKQWLVSKKEYLEKAAKEGQKGNFIESATRIRLRKTVENNNSEARIDSFPNEDVYRAYAEPEVDSNEQRFKWTRVRFGDLYEYMWTKLGWSREKVEKQTHGAFKRWDDFMEQSVQQYQMRITAFTRPLVNATLAGDPNLEPTARVKAALERLNKKKGLTSQASTSEAPSTSASAAKPIADDDFYDVDVDLAMSQTLLQPTSATRTCTSGKSGKSLTARKAPARKKAAPARRAPAKKTTKARASVRSKPQKEEEEEELNLSESSSSSSGDA
ncbi:DNA repair protein complementing XP-G cells isoform X1 [Aphelenchoides avenae]|nr:DNA repair protein complementing XP-G cells isoform X1 [Aphelenchus avenae]